MQELNCRAAVLARLAFENNVNFKFTFLHAVTQLSKLLPELSVPLPWFSETSYISGHSKLLKKENNNNKILPMTHLYK